MDGEARTVRPFSSPLGPRALEILDALPDVVCATSSDLSQLLYLNDAAEELFGRPRSDFAANPGLLLDVVHPGDWPRLSEALRRILVEGRFELEYRITRPDGQTRWLSDHSRMQFDSAGIPARIFSIRRDITSRRRSEQTSRQSGRLAAMGTLAAGIAHEINNPIGAALLAAETALAVYDRPEQDELLGMSLRSTVNSLNRCGEIVRNILRFARDENSEKSPGSLNQCVRQARDLVRTFAESQGVTMQACLDEQLPPVLMNSLEIEQVVVNLLYNAIQASPRGSRVRAATRQQEGTVLLVIEDQGRGMSDEEQQHVFDPFFTTRRDTGGTGLGMSILFGIVQDHSGAIRIQSEPGRGTAITVQLPTAKPDESQKTCR
jgi:two-component system, cell cycle sensor histidine kinase and response regulator CckA